MALQMMLSRLRKGITQYKMIKDGDKIAVGLSGGKDSITLLKLLNEYRKFSPEKFDLVAISVDLRFNGEDSDLSPLAEFCRKEDIEFQIVKTDIASVVFDVRKESNPCALCAKMRKGALYNQAVASGCNKVALGHHADDLIETFLLSLFYEGRLSTFAPKCYLSKTDLTLIRPMIILKERDITAFARDLPVIESKCPANKETKREDVGLLLKSVAKDIPNVREMIYTALTNPQRYNLFDKFNEIAEKY